jgi:NAD kinase
MFEKVVVITRRTRLDELRERFNTLGQAKFYIEHSGGNFAEYAAEDDAYRQSLEVVEHSLDFDLKSQFVDRAFLPTFLFTEKDLVVTLGQDGLVANTAKYVKDQPIVAVNPDPARFDGILLPFLPGDLKRAVEAVLAGKESSVTVTMAEAVFSDGQRMRAFNDLFIGPKTHISARYRLHFGKKEEIQSSSGILVSTGAGSTGWLSSVFNMTEGVSSWRGGKAGNSLRMAWNDPRLAFVVREPFRSNHSSADVVAGMIEQGQELVLESIMPSGGCVFSDGIEADFIDFNSGATATIRASAQGARLVTK